MPFKTFRKTDRPAPRNRLITLLIRVLLDGQHLVSPALQFIRDRVYLCHISLRRKIPEERFHIGRGGQRERHSREDPYFCRDSKHLRDRRTVERIGEVIRI